MDFIVTKGSGCFLSLVVKIFDDHCTIIDRAEYPTQRNAENKRKKNMKKYKSKTQTDEQIAV